MRLKRRGRVGVAWRTLAAALLVVAPLGQNEVIAAPALADQSAIEAPATPTDAAIGNDAMAPSPTWLDAAVVGLAVIVVACFAVRGWLRLDRAPRQPFAFTPEFGVVLALGMVVLASIGGAITREILRIPAPSPEVTPPVRDMVLMACGAYAGQAVALSAWLWKRSKARRLNPDARPVRGMAALFAVAIAPLAMIVTMATGILAGWMIGGPHERIAHDTLRELSNPGWDGWTLGLAATALIAAPLFEEVLYRGIIQRSLVTAGVARWPAIALTSAVFVAFHISVVPAHMLMALGALSLAIGWIQERTGRLTAAVTLHALFNAGNLLLARLTAGGP